MYPLVVRPKSSTWSRALESYCSNEDRGCTGTRCLLATDLALSVAKGSSLTQECLSVTGNTDDIGK